MSIIWNFLKTIYNALDEFIREEIPIHFFVAIAFLLLWFVILFFGVGLVYISFMDWTIGAWIIGIILGFEFLCALGNWLMR